MQFVVSKQNLQKELGLSRESSRRRTPFRFSQTYSSNQSARRRSESPGTDLDVTIRCDMDAEEITTPGSMCVQARKLFEIARLLPDAPVSFKKEENEWVTGEMRSRQVQDGWRRSRCVFRKVPSFKSGSDQISGCGYQDVHRSAQSSRSLRKSRATRFPELSSCSTARARAWLRLTVTGLAYVEKKNIAKNGSTDVIDYADSPKDAG
jgi:hypothetical protein